MKKRIPSVRLSQLLSIEFLNTSKQFTQYFEYCNLYCNANHLLQTLLVEREGLNDYLDLLSRNPRSQGMDLFSYLIKPIQVIFITKNHIQRICKYPLFFSRLLSHMEENHPFRRSIEDLNAHIVEIVKNVPLKANINL